MNRNVLWIFLVTAPLVSADSLESFQATCGPTATGGYHCGGIYTNGLEFSFGFVGPFPGSPGFGIPGGGPRYANGQPPPPIDIGVGTRGGTFSSQGHTCNYGDVLGGVDCDGEVFLGAELGAPDDTGLSLGDVVSVVGTGKAQGFLRDGEFMASFGLPEVHATYQFTLTDPGTFEPFSWTGAQFSFGSAPVPEPGTWVFATIGLAGLAAGFLGRRRSTQARS